MTSPIVWALTVFGAAGLMAVVTVEHLAGRAPVRENATSSAPLRNTPEQGHGIVRLVSDRGGHYHADIAVEGRVVRMLVDTGASLVVLRESDARAAGVRPELSSRVHQLSTANGIVEAKGVMIREMRLGPIIVRDVDAVVMSDGQLGSNLLGMSFLRQLRSFEVARGELILRH